jgi:hypothetical protein
MAATITRQTLVDGSKHLVLKITIEGDAAGDLTDAVLVDASTYTPAFTDEKIDHIESQLVGFTAKLLWDAATNVFLASLHEYDLEYGKGYHSDEYGGFPNNAGTGKTGDILITTSGLAAGDHGTIILHIVKK